MAAAASSSDSGVGTTVGGPTESLPLPVPNFIVFFMPHMGGTVVAALLESLQVELRLE